MIKYKQNLALKRHGWKADAKRADRILIIVNLVTNVGKV